LRARGHHDRTGNGRRSPRPTHRRQRPLHRRARPGRRAQPALHDNDPREHAIINIAIQSTVDGERYDYDRRALTNERLDLYDINFDIEPADYGDGDQLVVTKHYRTRPAEHAAAGRSDHHGASDDYAYYPHGDYSDID